LLLASFVLFACPTPSAVDAGVQDSGFVDSGVPFDAGVIISTLIVKYPAGTHTLSVRGSRPPFNWNSGIAMQRLDAETWSLTVTTLEGDLEWKPLLDDATWSLGPNWNAHAGVSTEIAPRFFTTTGTWTRYWPSFNSTLLGNTRGVYVYLPPSYAENTAAHFPVVYMHDGQNLFDPNAAFGGVTWRVADTMNAGANDGSIREAIVIGPENAGTARIGEYTPTADPTYGGGDGGMYLRFMVEELKPVIDSTFRTKTSRADTVMLGSSLGGLISSYAGVTHADTFGCIGAMSPSTWWDGRVILSLVSQTGSTRPLRVYVDSGDSGDSMDDVTNTAALAGVYRSLGYRDGETFLYDVQPGGTHTEAAWASRLPGALTFLLGPAR
jgi:predicted alpha/beta superfamily hydrolase